MPFSIANYTVEVFTASAMSTGQCPAQACKTKLTFKEIGVKGNPFPVTILQMSNGLCIHCTCQCQWPMSNAKTQHSKLLSLFSQAQDSVCNESNGFQPCLWHVWLHAHAQPPNHGIPLSINIQKPHVSHLNGTVKCPPSAPELLPFQCPCHASLHCRLSG